MKLPDHVSESVKRRNPELYSAAPVAGLPDPQREPDQRGQGKDNRLEASKNGIRYRVVIISIRRRLVDGHDNIRSGGAKALVDRITERLGFGSDNDERLEWCYHQIIGRPLGTVVIIQRQ